MISHYKSWLIKWDFKHYKGMCAGDILNSLPVFPPLQTVYIIRSLSPLFFPSSTAFIHSKYKVSRGGS